MANEDLMDVKEEVKELVEVAEGVVEEVKEVVLTPYQKLVAELDALQNGRNFSDIPLGDAYFDKRKELDQFLHIHAQN